MRGPAACRGEWAGSLPLPSPPLPGPSLPCPANAWLCPGAVGSPSMAASWGRVLLHRQVQGLRGAQMGVGSPDEAAGASCPPRANPPGTWWAPAPPAGTSFRRLALDGVRPPAPWHLRLLTRRVTAARGCHLSRPFPGALTFGETGGLSRPRSHRVRGPGVPVTDSTGLGPPDAACGEQRATCRPHCEQTRSRPRLDVTRDASEPLTHATVVRFRGFLTVSGETRLGKGRNVPPATPPKRRSCCDSRRGRGDFLKSSDADTDPRVSLPLNMRLKNGNFHSPASVCI